MAGTTIEAILNSRVLSGAIQKTTMGLPTGGLPNELVNPTGAMLRNVVGDSATFITGRGSRRTASQAHRDAPAVKRATIGVGEQSIKLLNFKNTLEVKADTLMGLQSSDAMTSQIAQDEVGRRVKIAAQEVQNSRVAAVSSSLALGALYYDGNGDMLPTSSGAVVSIDLGVPSANKSQIARGTSGASLVTESWANSTAKIITHMQNINTASVKLSGQRLTTAYYGANIINYFLNNNQTMDLINANNAFQTAFAGLKIPDGFLGLKWYPLHEQFYEDSSGTNQTFSSADVITFTPDPNAGWYEMTVGTTPVPTKLSVDSDVSATLASLSNAQGQYAYAFLNPGLNPVAATMVYGDCVLPWFPVPEAVFIATVVF